MYNEDLKDNIDNNNHITTITEVFSNPFLLYPCIAFAVWDAITTGIGTIAILGGNGLFTYIGSALVTCFTTSVLFSSFKLFQVKSSEAVKGFVRILFLLVILYDLYTSYYGAKFATFSGAKGATGEIFYDMTFSKGFVVLMLTILAVSATMISSWLYHENKYGPLLKNN